MSGDTALDSHGGDGGFTYFREYDRLPFNVVNIGGTLFDEKTYMEPLSSELRERTEDINEVIVPQIDNSDPTKNFDDDARQVRGAMGDRDNLLVVAHSRGIEGAVRALDSMAKDSRLDRVKALMILNNGGPHGVELPANHPLAAPELRYTERFTEGIVNLPEEMYEFDPDIAREVFGHNIRDKELLDVIIGGMRRQRSAKISATPLPSMPKGFPVFVIQGKQDRALNLERARAVYDHWLPQANHISVPDGGHMLPVEQPVTLASRLIRLGMMSRMLRSAT